MQESPDGSREPTFEEAMAELESITRQLEDGDLGLNESLACYERGVGFLKQCHSMLEQAERKISLLTQIGEDGEARYERFDESTMSLEEKQAARPTRRSRRSPPEESVADDEVDRQQDLF